ncbi:MAG: roadblock/LC7 domain-containing protein, partial [Deltaproteobacteria bacterium]|nr:roadblock/LC7 domain-containing protein [Deltaproteobacteria bacterium]
MNAAAGPAAALHSLRDLDGVFGSFLLDGEGQPVARDVAAIVDDELLGAVGPRVHRLLLGFSESIAPRGVVVRFEEHKLWLRPVDDHLLCVIGTPAVNAAALRMALTLVARRLARELSAAPPAASVPPPVVEPAAQSRSEVTVPSFVLAAETPR